MEISDDQYQAFEERQLEGDIQRLMEGLSAEFPEVSAALGPAGLRDFVVAGLAQASGHGIEGTHDAALFLWVRARFGPGFDVDPALPWAGRLLRSPLLGSPSNRVEQLHGTAVACATRSGRPHVPFVPPWQPGAA